MPEPLARLFLSAAGVIVDELHAMLAERGWADVRPSWGFIAGRLAQGDASVTELARFLGVSKQAASKALEPLLAAGVVEILSNPVDGRARLVRLTERGMGFRRDVAACHVEIEDRFASTIGSEALERMRSQLETSLRSLHDGELPPPAPLKQ